MLGQSPAGGAGGNVLRAGLNDMVRDFGAEPRSFNPVGGSRGVCPPRSRRGRKDAESHAVTPAEAPARRTELFIA